MKRRKNRETGHHFPDEESGSGMASVLLQAAGLGI